MANHAQETQWQPRRNCSVIAASPQRQSACRLHSTTTVTHAGEVLQRVSTRPCGNHPRLMDHCSGNDRMNRRHTALRAFVGAASRRQGIGPRTDGRVGSWLQASASPSSSLARGRDLSRRFAGSVPAFRTVVVSGCCIAKWRAGCAAAVAEVNRGGLFRAEETGLATATRRCLRRRIRGRPAQAGPQPRGGRLCREPSPPPIPAPAAQYRASPLQSRVRQSAVRPSSARTTLRRRRNSFAVPARQAGR